MLKIKTILATLAVVTFLLPNNQLSVKANPTSSENSTPTEQTKNTEQPKSIYEQAKQELPHDLYALYRIVDRIARANGLDEKPWRSYFPNMKSMPLLQKLILLPCTTVS